MTARSSSKPASMMTYVGRVVSDIEAALGFQIAARASIDLEEATGYLDDHVISEEGGGITAHDRRVIGDLLQRVAGLLRRAEIARLSFALPSTAVAARLIEAAKSLGR